MKLLLGFQGRMPVCWTVIEFMNYCNDQEWCLSDTVRSWALVFITTGVFFFLRQAKLKMFFMQQLQVHYAETAVQKCKNISENFGAYWLTWYASDVANLSGLVVNSHILKYHQERFAITILPSHFFFSITGTSLKLFLLDYLCTPQNACPQKTTNLPSVIGGVIIVCCVTDKHNQEASCATWQT